MEKSARLRNLLIADSSDQREDLIFSATMPLAKNQSFWITDKFDRRECKCSKDERGASDFCFFFLKKKIEGASCFGSFQKRTLKFIYFSDSKLYL